MKEWKKRWKAQLHQNRFVIGGFLLPFVIESIVVGVAFLFLHMGVVASDCYEQYIPFFSIYYDKLKEGTSLFYSWEGSMGFDFWNVFAYYLVSPWNFLMLLFPKRYIIYVVNFLILLKVALCGGTFSWYLQRKFSNEKTYFISLFGMLFALSGFLLGYCWNVMWLDSIVLFPLLMDAMDSLIYEKKGNRYCILLAATIVLNYFVGYLICIYIFVSFFTYEFKNWKQFMMCFVRIGIFSVIGLGMSAVILFPSFLGLTSTGISKETIPAMELYGNFGNVFATLGSFSVPIGISFDQERANLYIGEFALLLVFLYMCCKQIRKREKVQKLLLLVFLIVSCNFRPLNFIWHGFHEQRGIPNRFSFIIIFLMLQMAYEAWVFRKAFSEQELKRGMVSYTIAMLALTIVANEVWYCFVLAIGIGLLYGKCLYTNRNKTTCGKRLRFVLIGEATIMYIIAMCNCLGIFMAHYGEQIDDFELAKANVQQYGFREKMDQTLNRNELEWEEMVQNVQLEDMTPSFLLRLYDLTTNLGHMSFMNEASVYGIYSTTLFNTFNNNTMLEFYEKTGGKGSSSYVGYFGENSFMDMLLGIRYLYNRYHTVNSFAYEPIGTFGQVQLYENQYALSLGYVIPESLREEEKLLYHNPFITMNKMSQNVVGDDVYTLRKFQLEEVNGCTMETFTGTYGYFTNFVKGEANVMLSYEPQEEENLVIQLRNQELYLAEVAINGEIVISEDCHKHLLDLGIIQKGDKVTVVVHFSKEYEFAGLYLYAAALKQQVMKDVYEVLSQQQMKITSFEEQHIVGTIDIKDQQAYVLITLPYKKGWEFTVDGEVVEIDKEALWGGAFPVFQLTQGNHEIVCAYVTPMFYEGGYVSIGSILVFLLQWVVGKIQEKKKSMYEQNKNYIESL